MYDSGIKANELIAELQEEMDVALPISDRAYVDWLNSLEQLLYSEVIRDRKRSYQGYSSDTEYYLLNSFPVAPGEDFIRFSDIDTIYADDAELFKAASHIFDDTFFDAGEYLGVNLKGNPGSITIVYFARPQLKTIDDGEICEETIKIPAEFIDLFKSKLRGEAYKLANEDGIAAKWLNDYNVLLETFKAWVESRRPRFL